MKYLLSMGMAVALATGCGHDHDDGACGLEANCGDGLLEYMDGMVVEGDDGALAVRVTSANPDPPDPETANTWTIEVLDAEEQVISDAEITRINTWSIDCGHFGIEGPDGLDLSGIDNGDGTFTFEYYYAHGGPWDVEIDVAGAGETDTVTIGLCLPETGPHTHE